MSIKMERTSLSCLQTNLLLPEVEDIVKNALQEDIGPGDITTLLAVPPETIASASIITRQDGVVAGLFVVAEVYRQLDAELQITSDTQDGQSVSSGDTLCILHGRAQSILTGERVALNFLQHLSGIATRTSHFVKLIEDSAARIVDTRKTTPGLRSLEKYAVRAGGGFNHRAGLYDAILIKDNHIQACGSLKAAVESVKRYASHVLTVTVECDTLEQVEEAVAAGAHIVLLDNMDFEKMRCAVSIINGRCIVEASGGITEKTVRETALTGVDIISIGALTHSVTSLDLSLEMKLLG